MKEEEERSILPTEGISSCLLQRQSQQEQRQERPQLGVDDGEDTTSSWRTTKHRPADGLSRHDMVVVRDNTKRYGRHKGERRIPLFSSSSPSVLIVMMILLIAGGWNGRFVVVNATLYLDDNASYSTLPGLFGSFMMDGMTYSAHLQYLLENPYLCEEHDANKTTFIKPRETIVPSAEGHNATLVQPVVLLASRGNCPFYRKAKIAESIDDTIEYLIVHNYRNDNDNEDHGSSGSAGNGQDNDDDDDDDDSIVPMYAEYGNTRLVLLSVSHSTGQAMKRFIKNQTEAVAKDGGPLVRMDSAPPPGVLTVDDLYEMLLSALGLFFMLLSFSGCMVILAGTYGQLHDGGLLFSWTSTNGRRFTFLGLTVNGEAGAVDANGRPIRNSNGRRVLSTNQVRLISDWANNSNNNKETHDDINNNDCCANREHAGCNNNNSHPLPSNNTSGHGGRGDLEDNNNNISTGAAADYDNCCAVCIDEITPEEDADTLTLPCNHRFHVGCITPWLTERQAKCPLCKYDVLDYVHGIEDKQRSMKAAEAGDVTLNGAASRGFSTIWNIWRNRITLSPRRWTPVTTQDQQQQLHSNSASALAASTETDATATTTATATSPTSTTASTMTVRGRRSHRRRRVVYSSVAGGGGAAITAAVANSSGDGTSIMDDSIAGNDNVHDVVTTVVREVEMSLQ